MRQGGEENASRVTDETLRVIKKNDLTQVRQ